MWYNDKVYNGYTLESYNTYTGVPSRCLFPMHISALVAIVVLHSVQESGPGYG